MTDQRWPYPGSRWWRFDFHTHTPASRDTPWHQQGLDLQPRDWLLKYMQAGIDCVTVTDHNSGDWIDPLKDAYAALEQAAAGGQAPEGFRELTLFPGVEISVSGGWHLLAVFDPAATSRDIADLLARVEYGGTAGDSDAVTAKGPVEVIDAVLKAGAIPIPAHADRPGDGGKALLALREGRSAASRLDANTIRAVLENQALLAVEWEDPGRELPECVRRHDARLARVLGSDSHNFRGSGVPGSRYTWVKMAAPTLEGLRLALLDGNGVSVHRSDEQAFDPFKVPELCVTSIAIENARFMGNGQAEHLRFSPYFNALIGGRGTGKSTVVHAVRLAFRREETLLKLPESADPRVQFERFRQPVRGRSGDGALRDETRIQVELLRDGVAHRLHWSFTGDAPVVEQRDADGRWVVATSQAVNPNRFPMKIFSQGQVAAMAGDGRGALMDEIDDAAGVADLWRAFDEARSTWLAQRARLREIDQRLVVLPEVERKLADAVGKLDTLASSEHAAVLREHQASQRQRREVDDTLEQLGGMPERIDHFVDDLVADDWPAGVFAEDGNDADLSAWRRDADETLASVRESLAAIGREFRVQLETLRQDERLAAWRTRADAARSAYADLQARLERQGVADTQAFGRLVQERQALEAQRKTLSQLADDRRRAEADAQAQLDRVVAARQAIAARRADFLATTLHGNPFVRIELARFGFDSRLLDRSLRELLEIPPERFDGDILKLDAHGDAIGGLAYDLAQIGGDERALTAFKHRLTEPDENLGGHFRNHLKRKLERPELVDALMTWFPEDDLRIEYSRSGEGSDWSPIEQGSQGQRSAALLAFLLAFGEEPLVLDQPEDDLDNHLIYDLIVRQIRANKQRRQLIIVTHNANVLVNGDAEMVHVFDFRGGQCRVVQRGALQERDLRDEVCRVMEGGREAFARRWARLGREV